MTVNDRGVATSTPTGVIDHQVATLDILPNHIYNWRIVGKRHVVMRKAWKCCGQLF